MYKIGIDLGGTKIEGIVLDFQNKEVERKRIDTEQEKGYEHILSNIHGLYKELALNIGKHSFGIGTPGALSHKTGVMKNSNTTCLNGKPLKKDLEDLLQRPIGIANDANCFAMAEAMLGAGKGYRSVFGVIMGTGCGGGIVYDGEVINGIQSIAGEWGHMSIDPKNGIPCYCGNKGCTERYISGGGLASLYEKNHGLNKKFALVVEDYRHGNVQDKLFFEDFIIHFGIALANVINILDPEIVVLGGGLSNVDELYTLGIDSVKNYVFTDHFETKIVKNVCGDSAGVLGAAFIGI